MQIFHVSYFLVDKIDNASKTFGRSCVDVGSAAVNNVYLSGSVAYSLQNENAQSLYNMKSLQYTPENSNTLSCRDFNDFM